MSIDGQGTKWRRNIAENINRLSRVHQRYRLTTDDRQTGGRWHIANMNLSSRSLINDTCVVISRPSRIVGQRDSGRVCVCGSKFFTIWFIIWISTNFDNLYTVYRQSNNQSHIPRCMECRRGLTMKIWSVRPSVRPSVWSRGKFQQNNPRTFYPGLEKWFLTKVFFHFLSFFRF